MVLVINFMKLQFDLGSVFRQYSVQNLALFSENGAGLEPCFVLCHVNEDCFGSV